jgi:two-component system chemotaxis response regulator CheY
MARILIIDDDEFMRMAIKDTLLKHGHDIVAEMAEGEDAFQAYLELKPNLLLMDIKMPDTGWKKSLKNFLVTDKDAKTVDCSSIGQKTMITESMEIGTMGFIAKQYGHNGILDVMKKIGEPN